jgi:hypothetical protein
MRITPSTPAIAIAASKNIKASIVFLRTGPA